MIGLGIFHSTRSIKVATNTLLQTATVKRCILVISASGTGSVISENETQLGFATSVILAQLIVVVGDEVNKGDVLAVSAPGDDVATIQSRLT